MGKLKAKSGDRFYSWWIGLSHKSRVRFSFIVLGLCSALSFVSPVGYEITEETAVFDDFLGFFFIALFGFCFVVFYIGFFTSLVLYIGWFIR